MNAAPDRREPDAMSAAETTLPAALEDLARRAEEHYGTPRAHSL